jgi:AcrR family transcriptional regulator
MDASIELPLIAAEPAERADAARNRARILAAAERLFAERGAGCVSMEEVAQAACVGKGTLFRRFGSRAALAQAVLSERERAEGGSARYGSPPYGVHRLHLTLLLHEADPTCDAEYLSEALLACLAADLFLYMREAREMPLERLKAGWAELVRRSLPAPAGSPG